MMNNIYVSAFDHMADHEEWGAIKEGHMPPIMKEFSQLPADTTVEQILDELGDAISTPDSLERTAAVIWRTQQIIRTVIEYKNSFPNKRGVISTIQATIDFGLHTYRNWIDRDLSKFSELREYIDNRIDITFTSSHQRSDHATMAATHPFWSERTALRLQDRVSDNAYFLLIANGGIAAGMDVILRFAEKKNLLCTPSTYAFRLSTHKVNDKDPKLTRKEKRKLKLTARNSDEIIILDEDTYSGETLYLASQGIRKVVPRDKRDSLYVTTNMKGENQDGILQKVGQMNLSKFTRTVFNARVSPTYQELMEKKAWMETIDTHNQNMHQYSPIEYLNR